MLYTSATSEKLSLSTLQPSTYTRSAIILHMSRRVFNKKSYKRPPDSNESWRRSSSNQLNPIDEKCFTLVSRPRPQVTRGGTAYSRPPNPSASTNLRSTAAVSRATVYERPISSHYKQSCLPSEQRDPILLEAELKQGTKLPKEAFKPGAIIRAVLHEQDFQGAAGASDVIRADKYKTDSVYGRICTKARKMIVMATFEDNYIAVPIYTHNGRGLEGKAKPQEFVSVRDHRTPGSFTQLSSHRPLRTERLSPEILPFQLKSIAHITYPVSRKYTLPVVHEGYLEKESIDQLATLFAKAISPFLKMKKAPI
ncbi:hypothetical protein MMC07_002395 [Pseudocyphellaria aurata]|nr:hypothetical protein [Pseudocyphellaria aurata]